MMIDVGQQFRREPTRIARASAASPTTAMPSSPSISAVIAESEHGMVVDHENADGLGHGLVLGQPDAHQRAAERPGADRHLTARPRRRARASTPDQHRADTSTGNPRPSSVDRKHDRVRIDDRSDAAPLRASA